MNYQSVNPYDGRAIKSFPEHTDEEVSTAVTNAQYSYEKWRWLTFSQRATVASTVASIMRSRVDEFAKLVTQEMGKLIEEARGEVLLSADIIEYYALNAEAFLAPETLHPSAGEAEIHSTPLGIIFGVQPWNFPYYQLARFAGPNLMAGNVVVVKHANCVPQCAIMFEKVWLEAGAPVGTYTNLRISHDQINRLIADPRIKGVALTGGIDAAKSVASRAGLNLKKTTLELGGNDAFIVLEDADIDATVRWAVWSKMNNTGQSCIAGKRFILVEAIADEFLEKFQQSLVTLTPGDPLDPATTLAPLSSEAALGSLLSQVDQAVSAGAKVALGGKRFECSGAFMQPTILTNISADNPVYRAELFGPVALCFRVKDEEEAIALANDSDYGLGGCVFTRNVERGKHVASRVEAGMMFINHPTWTSADLPFGGAKNSGYGRELSRQGIQEFVNKKLVRVSDINDPV